MSGADDELDLLGPAGAALAAELEAADDVPSRRDQFLVPDGVAYLAGNSLGLQPRAARAAVDDVLGAWAAPGVAAHLEGAHPWAPYHETMRETVAALVGARPGEAVVMNSLTVNLHLLLRQLLPADGRAAPRSSSRPTCSRPTATP